MKSACLKNIRPDVSKQNFSSLNENDLFLLNFFCGDITAAVKKSLMPDGFNPGSAIACPVVWEDGESEIIMHLDKIRTALKPGFIIFEITLEADQSGIVNLVIPFRVGKSIKEASLIITTENLPRGNSHVAARWGTIVQDNIWFALLEAGEGLKNKKYSMLPMELSGICTDGEQITFIYSRPVSAKEIVEYVKKVKEDGLDPGEEIYNPQPVDLEKIQEEPINIFLQFWLEFIALLRQFIRFGDKLVRLLIYCAKKLKKFFLFCLKKIKLKSNS